MGVRLLLGVPDIPAISIRRYHEHSNSLIMVSEMEDDQYWMDEALKEADLALEKGEVPVGAVVVLDGMIIGRGHNMTEELSDPTAHAEIIALGAAGSTIGDWRMPDSTLYVTLEPCTMCTGAILLSRLGTLVYGADDPLAGACGSKLDLIGEARLAGRLQLRRSVKERECRGVLQSFFDAIRNGSMRRGAGAVERGGLENR